MISTYAIGAIGIALMFLSCVFGMVFAWVTMRKLRKNPLVKDYLGVEFIGGHDAFKVGQSLTFPKFTAKRTQTSEGREFNIDPKLLYKHTTKFDRILARVFYMLTLVSTAILIPLALAHFFS